MTIEKFETALRVFLLGAVYASAAFFAIAFSPSMGFISVTPDAGPAPGRVASATLR
jgi:hypothetical protein